MLIKKELLTVPLSEYPKIAKAEKSPYAATAQIVSLPRSGKILIIDIFCNEEKIWKLRFVSDKKNALLCTKWPAKEWMFKYVWSALKLSKYSLDLRYTNIHKKDLDTVCDFFDITKEYMRNLERIMNDFVYSIYYKKAEKLWERKYGKLQEHMDMYPDYPKNLAEYCDKYVFEHTWIYISKATDGKRNAVCCLCRKKFKVDKSVKSGNMGNCPKCNKTAKYRGEWLSCSPIETTNICISAKVDDQLLLRWTRVKRQVSQNKKSCYHTFDDYYYNLYLENNKETTIFSYAYHYVLRFGWQWWRKDNGTINNENTHVYIDNLSQVFGNRYCNVNLEKGLSQESVANFAHLIRNLKDIPAAEYLFKFGLIKLAASNEAKEIKSRNFTKAFGIKKELFSMLRRQDPSWMEVEVVKAANSWISEEAFVKYRKLKLDEAYEDVIEVLQEMSFERLTNYFTKQRENHKKLKTSKQIIQWYIDYIDICKRLKVDLIRKSIRFPQNIKDAHDRIVERYNSIKHEIEEADFIKVNEKLYDGIKEYKKGEHKIVLPSSRKDLITEGQSLNHCVGTDSYYKNHIKGKRMIFFIRKTESPKKPYFTMEVDMREVKLRQLYGFGDSSPPKEVRNLANDFLSKLKQISA